MNKNTIKPEITVEAKVLKRNVYRQYKQEVIHEVTNVIHNLPTWMFPEGIGSSLKTPCPVCHQEMRLNIGHGSYLEECSMIEVDGHDVLPIHTSCYFKLSEKGGSSE